jgi:hypothetical protein
MKVIIAGSRTIKDYKSVEYAIKKSGFQITAVISGKEPNGVDRLGEEWADAHCIPVIPFPADWNNLNTPGAVIKINAYGKQYNAKAGFDRNKKMSEIADALIAITTGSPGTKNMIELMSEKPTYIKRVRK